MRRRWLSPSSLPARVFRLIVGVILLTELGVATPWLAREREAWLRERVQQAQLVAISAGLDQRPVDPLLARRMLRLSDTVAIRLEGGGREISLLPATMPKGFGGDIDLDRESFITGMVRAEFALFDPPAPYERVFAASIPANDRIEVIVSSRELTRHLRGYELQAVTTAVLVALVTAVLVFTALDRNLVQPLRVMTASIARFRRNPGYAGLGGLKWLGGRGDDEISRAARELVEMQDALRSALWRNARLAGLGTSVAKINHDLRNVLATALLVADRFQQHEDPVVKKAAGALVPALERATDLASRTVEYAFEGPPTLARSPVALHALVEEVAESLQKAVGQVAIENLIPEELTLSLDRNQIFRVMVNLLRNAVEAGAGRVKVTLADPLGTTLVIADDGPGLPRKVMANLFRPFNGAGRDGGTGLGLSIARDLVRAHGGDLLLLHSAPQGTAFSISFDSDQV